VIELSWRAGLDEDESAEVLALASTVTDADGVAPLSEHVLMHLRSGGGVAHLLARDADGTLLAAAQLDAAAAAAEGATAELAVHPAHRRAGLGARVVEALVERRPPGGPLRAWAHGDHPGAAALAARFGFDRVRELWQMDRSLLEPPLAEPEFPAGVTLRPFVVGQDEAEFLRVNNAAFDWHPEQGGWDLGQIELREAEPWFDPAGFLLAVDSASGKLLGFHWTKVHPESGSGESVRPALGEVYVLGVDPSARGMRLGAALTLAGLRHLRDAGLARVNLYVEGDNAAAIRVYNDLRFAQWNTDVSYEQPRSFTR